MINDQIADTIQEVGEVLESMPEGSMQRELMYDAHRALTLAHSLIHKVNSVQLARMLRGIADGV